MFFMRVSDTDGFELTATDIQLDNPIEPGSIIAIKRPIKVSLTDIIYFVLRGLYAAMDYTIARSR